MAVIGEQESGPWLQIDQPARFPFFSCLDAMGEEEGKGGIRVGEGAILQCFRRFLVQVVRSFLFFLSSSSPMCFLSLSGFACREIGRVRSAWREVDVVRAVSA